MSRTGPLGGLMDIFQQHGWDGLDGHAQQTISDAQRQITAAETVERRRQARVFLDTFDTPAGQQCLELLKAKTMIGQPPSAADLAMTDPAAFALSMARKQGATNLVWHILSAIEYARGEEPTATTETT